MNNKKIEILIKDLLIELGEDPNREGLKKTPERVSRMLKINKAVIQRTRKKVVNDALFTQKVT